jgi:hypothetical protein
MAMKDNFGTVSFLIIYLVVIWAFLIKIIIENRNNLKNKGDVWKLVFLGYFLLALGDIAHLGFRIYMFFAQTPIESELASNLFGYGYIITSITMTCLYIALFEAWKLLYASKYSTKKMTRLYELVIFLSMIFRVVLLLLPWNHWFDINPVWEFGFDFRIISAVPFYIIGAITIGLLLKDSIAEKKSPTNINSEWNEGNYKASIWFIISFIFYSITTFLIIYIPITGMFMVPKTVAYLFALYYHYKYLLKKKD